MISYALKFMPWHSITKAPKHSWKMDHNDILNLWICDEPSAQVTTTFDKRNSHIQKNFISKCSTSHLLFWGRK